MIEQLKSLVVGAAELGWHAPFAAAIGAAASALAPLVALSRAPVAARLAPAPTLLEAKPMPSGAHWRLVADRIETRLSSARKVSELQSAARVLLDAADFTLSGIIDDLTDVMPRASEIRWQTPRPLPVPLALAA